MLKQDKKEDYLESF